MHLEYVIGVTGSMELSEAECWVPRVWSWLPMNALNSRVVGGEWQVPVVPALWWNLMMFHSYGVDSFSHLSFNVNVGIPCKPHILAYKGMARYGCRCFSKLQFTQQHNWEKVGDCSLIDNSKGYMLIKKFSQSDKIWGSWKYEGESMKLADSTPSPDHVTTSL